MNRIVMTTCAALIGAAAMAALGGTAEAAGKRATPQLVIFKAGKAVVKDNFAGKSGADLGQFSGSPAFIQFTMPANSVKVSRTGSGATKTLLMIVLGAPDVRTATLPLTISVASGSNPTVTGTYNEVNAKYVGRFPTGMIQQTTKSWVIAENAVGSFSVTFKAYSAATNRVSGTFAGTMAAGDNNPLIGNIAITKGKFNVNCAFNGL